MYCVCKKQNSPPSSMKKYKAKRVSSNGYKFLITVFSNVAVQDNLPRT